MCIRDRGQMGAVAPNCLKTGCCDYRKFVEKFFGRGVEGARTIRMKIFAKNYIQIS